MRNGLTGQRSSRWAFYLSLFLFTVACGTMTVTISGGALETISQSVCAIGHPLATYKSAEITGIASGGCGSASVQQVDLAIHYRSPLRRKDDVMAVRFFVDSIQPCVVRAEVQDDSGPPPVLMLATVITDAVGQMVCDELSPTQTP